MIYSHNTHFSVFLSTTSNSVKNRESSPCMVLLIYSFSYTKKKKHFSNTQQIKAATRTLVLDFLASDVFSGCSTAGCLWSTDVWSSALDNTSGKTRKPEKYGAFRGSRENITDFRLRIEAGISYQALLSPHHLDQAEEPQINALQKGTKHIL